MLGNEYWFTKLAFWSFGRTSIYSDKLNEHQDARAMKLLLTLCQLGRRLQNLVTSKSPFWLFPVRVRISGPFWEISRAMSSTSFISLIYFTEFGPWDPAWIVWYHISLWRFFLWMKMDSLVWYQLLVFSMKMLESCYPRHSSAIVHALWKVGCSRLLA